VNIVQPKVFLIAGTELYEDAVEKWLNHIGGGAVLDHISGTDGEKLIELAARRCYKSFDVGLNPNITQIRRDSLQYHANILNQRHGSVLAHDHMTFAFEGVSRVFTHELVRNTIGNAFSQESMRYVRLDSIPFWFPPEIEADIEAKAKFIEVVEYLEDVQAWLADHFKIADMKDFGKKKILTSIFRRLAPEGVATGIVTTFNDRSFRWLAEQRTSRHAEHEIRLAANAAFDLALEHCPQVLQDFELIDTGDELGERVPKNSKV
jgi:thymidylate synthase (FAD)